MQETNVTRRDFVKTAAATGALASAAGLTPALGQDAKKVMKVALVGCGGRGSGAIENHKRACEHVGVEFKVVATADAFKGQAEGLGGKYGVPADHCFGGFDAYKKAIDAGPDVVLLATPPAFRPVHLEYAINAGKNVFMEKPVAVDPPGIRKVIAAGEMAKQKGLAIVAGTQRRHEKGYLQNFHRVSKGAIGDIKGGAVRWLQARLWFKTRNPGENDAEYMARNWVNFTSMSGDHIVEQHVHNIDVALWFIGRPPVTALGFGGRARRKTGDQYDFFSVDFDFGQGVHINSACRQVNGTYGGVNEFFVGSKGEVYGNGKITGDKIDAPDFEEVGGPYVQEHIDLLRSILAGKPLNEAQQVANSTMAAIMGRISAYTGQIVRWSDVMENEKSPFYSLTCTPTALDFETGNVKCPAEETAPVPGND
ncbi:MAG: Gfo/Idh/MocA family oxidoreductase [Kiritimatiellia bacterium]